MILLLPVYFLPFLLCSYFIQIMIVNHMRTKFRRNTQSKKKQILKELGLHGENSQLRFVGFFHPYCNAGGGGERVLWTAVAHMQRIHPNIICVVYSGDKGVNKQDIIDKVDSRFSITLNSNTLHFIFLKSRYLVEDSTWPRFTLIGQSLGSIYLALEAVNVFTPDLFVDTMGYAFTFYPVRLFCQVPVGAYVHYPTISRAMVNRIGFTSFEELRRGELKNQKTESTLRKWGRTVKTIYYTILMHLYALSLLNASFLMVNSSWTKAHVDEVIAVVNTKSGKKASISRSRCFTGLWWFVSRVLCCGIWCQVPSPVPPSQNETKIVYPPCDTKRLTSFPLTGRRRIIVSLAQFRPEKDHIAQIEAFAELLKQHPEHRQDVKLVLMGSSRNEEDAARVNALKDLASAHNVSENVDFEVNVPYDELLNALSEASIGISTMVDEHFGINIVEFMAAGLIPIVHGSGGPLYDIVVPHDGGITGYHAKTPELFASAMHEVISLTKEEDLAIRTRARRRAVQVFSEEEFIKGWEDGWKWEG